MAGSDNSALGREAMKHFSVSFKTQINVGDLAVYSVEEERPKIRYSILFLEPAFWIVSRQSPISDSSDSSESKVFYVHFGVIEKVGDLPPAYRIFRANSPEEVIVPREIWQLGASSYFAGFVTESFYNRCVIESEG